MGDLKLQGQKGFFGAEAPVKHKKLLEVSEQELKAATKDNNLDEMVVETTSGEKYVVYADELNVKGGKMPKTGDSVNLPFLDESAKVVMVDDEWNEDYGYAGMAAGAGLVGLAASKVRDTFMQGGGISGKPQSLMQFTRDAEVSQKELKWAQSYQEKRLDPKKLSKVDEERYDDIMTRHGKEQKINNTPYPGVAGLTNGDVLWAQKLESKVHKGYQPVDAEMDRYKQIFSAMNPSKADANEKTPAAADPTGGAAAPPAPAPAAKPASPAPRKTE